MHAIPILVLMEESVMIMIVPVLVKMTSMDSTANIVEVKDSILIKCYNHFASLYKLFINS